MKKFLILVGLLFFIGCGIIGYDIYITNKIPVLDIEDSFINIDKLYIYGTHLNMEGKYDLEENAKLVLYNGEFIEYEININNNKFNFSNYINNGLYLDDIDNGEYYLFFRTEYLDNNEIKYKYYALNNNTNYLNTTYYTMSNYNKKITISNDISYPTIKIKVNNNIEDNIYDIVLDPGHGGIDGGASKNGYKETDFTMKIATLVKEKLEQKGFKVKLTYEDGQLNKNEKLNEYGINGRAVVPREVNGKYLFSFHLNSSNYSSVSGLEVYTAKNINYDFAKLLINNIINLTNLKYSNNKINKIDNSIYSRNFTKEDIDKSMNDYLNKDLKPYDISINSNYYYMIRETGGIVTGAYVDDRNEKIIGNPYVNSNVGTEAYLLELGYISNKNDLNNIISNLDKYVEAIVVSINSLYF